MIGSCMEILAKNSSNRRTGNIPNFRCKSTEEVVSQSLMSSDILLIYVIFSSSTSSSSGIVFPPILNRSVDSKFVDDIPHALHMEP